MEKCEEVRSRRSSRSVFTGVSGFTGPFLVTFCVREGGREGKGTASSKEQPRGGSQKVQVETACVGGTERGGRTRDEAGMENVGMCRDGENQ